MNEIARIQAALRPHLSWHGARLKFLALFLVALYQFDKLQLHIQVGFDFAQPTFLERSRKEDL